MGNDYNTGYSNSGDYNTGYRNTGYWNTGDWNTGDWNTGDHNTGYSNTGYRNAGDHNTGYNNTGNNHTGCFNTTNCKKAYYFNVLTDVKTWDKAYKPDWLFKPSPTSVVNGKTTANNMTKEWLRAYRTASKEDVQAVIDLPNFSYKVFEEITGLDLRANSDDCTGETVVVDGVEYTLTRKR